MAKIRFFILDSKIEANGVAVGSVGKPPPSAKHRVTVSHLKPHPFDISWRWNITKGSTHLSYPGPSSTWLSGSLTVPGATQQKGAGGSISRSNSLIRNGTAGGNVDLCCTTFSWAYQHAPGPIHFCNILQSCINVRAT